MKAFRPTWLGEVKKREVQGGRINPNKKFYQSKRWRNHRKLFLQLHPLCVECEKKGIIRPAKVVDHIVRINDGGDPFDYSNLQPMCSSCHNKKSGRERWQNRVK